MGDAWRVRWGKLGEILGGSVILGACYWAGLMLKAAGGLLIPAGILGLFILLVLLGSGLVRLAWVESAAALFLFLLPLWLLPVFVGVAEDRNFWRHEGPLFLATVVAGLLILWAFVGHLAQLLFARLPGDLREPGPLTDAEQRRAAADVADEEVAP